MILLASVGGFLLAFWAAWAVLLAHSFRSLLRELALRTRNTIELAGTDAAFAQHTEPSPLQARALELVEQAPQLV